ncbi:MAG: RNA polymerase sigma factor [Bacteroidales bacterium]|nr:RNA polymerase sigma factor [Bacteroidales bacterium]
MKAETERIISLIKAGNQEGFQAAINIYGSRIHAFLLDITGSAPDAEELANDTFIKAFTNIHQYNPDKSRFDTWLFSIAHNSAISHLRKFRPQIVDIDSLKDNLTQSDISETDLINILQRAIAMLPPDDRAVIHHFYYQKASLDDISRITGISPGNIAVRLHRIRRKLKDLIETINHHDR